MTGLFQKYELLPIEKKIGDVVMAVTFRIIDKETGEDVTGEPFALVHQAEAIVGAMNLAFLDGMIEMAGKMAGVRAPYFDKAMEIMDRHNAEVAG